MMAICLRVRAISEPAEKKTFSIVINAVRFQTLQVLLFKGVFNYNVY